MRNLNTAYAMDDEALIHVTGGDYGDSNYEHDHNVVLYKVGDTVEVFTGIVHLFTNRGQIKKISSGKVGKSAWSSDLIEAPLYLVEFESGEIKWVFSNNIERS